MRWEGKSFFIKLITSGILHTGNLEKIDANSHFHNYRLDVFDSKFDKLEKMPKI